MKLTAGALEGQNDTFFPSSYFLTVFSLLLYLAWVIVTSGIMRWYLVTPCCLSRHSLRRRIQDVSLGDLDTKVERPCVTYSSKLPPYKNVVSSILTSKKSTHSHCNGVHNVYFFPSKSDYWLRTQLRSGIQGPKLPWSGLLALSGLVLFEGGSLHQILGLPLWSSNFSKSWPVSFPWAQIVSSPVFLSQQIHMNPNSNESSLQHHQIILPAPSPL